VAGVAGGGVTPYYEDDHVTIYHGDCREIEAWLSADVLVTDPPYGYAYSSGKDGKFKGCQIANDDSLEVRDAVLAQWGNRPFIVFGSWKRQQPMNAHTALVWDKGMAAGMGNLSIPWKPNWDLIFVGGNGFSGRRDSGVISGHIVVTWSGRDGSRVHPNEKPCALLRDLIAKCPPGIIADPFMGSGSTLRAAKDLNRKAIGIEVDERYCEIAARRLAQEVLPL
jgi:site-specific DNA-methyltransferase (adenine-specific)